MLLALEIVTVAFAWWFGLYLLARNIAKPVLCLAGFGLLAYALGVAADALQGATEGSLALVLTRAHWLLISLPALFWSGALLYLLPDAAPGRARLLRGWRKVFLPLAAAVYALGATTGLAFGGTAAAPQVGPAYFAVAGLILLPLLLGLTVFWRSTGFARARHPLGLLLAAGLFFSLSLGLLLFPLSWLPRGWMVLGVGFDLALLGYAIAVLDAFDEGESLRPDMARSFAAAGGAALVFGAQVALVIVAQGGPTLGMLALLLATVVSATTLVTCASLFQRALDRVVFFGAPGLRRARAELRGAADALPRVDEALDLRQLDEAEFARLTRRALSHYGDLPRLAASPLARLPLVATRLERRGAAGDLLEAAVELKGLLAESVDRLKPRGRGDFGTSDEWRHYNALFFPYVAGLKPYSRRASQDGLDTAAEQALAWFQSAVPERTLYNWQTAAARLVAQDLRSRMDELPSGKNR